MERKRASLILVALFALLPFLFAATGCGKGKRGGAGWLGGSCRSCDGAGKTRCLHCVGGSVSKFPFEGSYSCAICRGSGWDRCSTCAGTGRR